MFDCVLYVMYLVSTDGDWQSRDKHNKTQKLTDGLDQLANI